MTVEIGIIISLIGCIIGIVSFILGQKKSSKDDGLSMGKFMGEINAKIANIENMITELKNDHKEVDVKIKEAIQQHVETYHSK